MLLDDGTVYLNPSLRRQLGVKGGDELNLTLEDGALVLRPVKAKEAEPRKRKRKKALKVLLTEPEAPKDKPSE